MFDKEQDREGSDGRERMDIAGYLVCAVCSSLHCNRAGSVAFEIVLSMCTGMCMVWRPLFGSLSCCAVGVSYMGAH
jgi:hypothetical protein